MRTQREEEKIFGWDESMILYPSKLSQKYHCNFSYFLNGYLTSIQVNPEDLFRQAFGGNFDFESIFGADPSGQGQQAQNQTRTRVN